LVYCASLLSLRKAVYACARRFQREFGYDFVQYGHEGRETDPLSRAFVWTDGWFSSGGSAIALPTKRLPRLVVGAGCFRWREWKNHAPSWGLQWVWFHHLARRKGNLTSAWPYFRARFGNFAVEPPVSAAMGAFLRKQAARPQSKA
jgi:hypothetical protein